MKRILGVVRTGTSTALEIAGFCLVTVAALENRAATWEAIGRAWGRKRKSREELHDDIARLRRCAAALRGLERGAT